MLLHVDLVEFYKTNFYMKKDYNFNLDEIDNMFPFEYMIYYNTILEWIEEEKKRLEKLKRKM